MKFIHRLAVVMLVFCALSPGTGSAQENDPDSLRQRAEQGNARAQTELGYLYHTGEGVPRDYREAVRWYRRAADQGQADAQYNLGVAYAFGEGVERDPKQATGWYRRAAEQGHQVAAFSLGLSYLYGDGVQQSAPQAAAWFRQAAEQGYTRAQVHLASLYHGGEGIPRDYAQAAYWYRQAAERANATAQYNLGNLYRVGRGVEKDYDEALRWYRLAAEQGYSPALAELETVVRQQQPGKPDDGKTPFLNLEQPPAESSEQPAGDKSRRIVSPPLDIAPITTLKVDSEIAGAENDAAEQPEILPGTTAQPRSVTIATEPETAGFARMEIGGNEPPAAEQTEQPEQNGSAPSRTAGPESAPDRADNKEPAEQPEATPERPGFFARLFGARPPESAEKSAAGEEPEATTADETPAAGTAEGGQAAQPDNRDEKEALALNAPPIERLETVTISAAAEKALDAGEYDKALPLLQAEALEGNAAAESRLGDLYSQGLGVEQNRDRALLWYRRAAKRNHADAQFSLGNMYLLGEGVLQNEEKARAWYKKAAAHGHQGARNNLRQLERRLAERRRYQPEQHDGTSRQELETAVEQNRPLMEEPVPDTGQAAGPTSGKGRIVSPPIEQPVAAEKQTAKNEADTSAAQKTDRQEEESSGETAAPPSSKRIVTPPLETAPD